MLTVRQIYESNVTRQTIRGDWLPVLPLPHPDLVHRIKDAWAVLRGRAYAVIQGD